MMKASLLLLLNTGAYGQDAVEGCMDEYATNYNPLATVQGVKLDGTPDCTYLADGEECTDYRYCASDCCSFNGDCGATTGSYFDEDDYDYATVNPVCVPTAVDDYGNDVPDYSSMELAQRVDRMERANKVSEEPSVMGHMWMILCGVLVMFMQAGFAMLEAGMARNMNVQSVLMKNMIDICIGTMGWFTIGWSLAYKNEKGDFIGGKSDFFLTDVAPIGDDGNINWANGDGTFRDWFFQWAFCATAATIVSGGVMERVNFWAYLLYTLVMTAFIYPVVLCNTWGYGMLDKKLDQIWIDFAGSGIVHLTGGMGALVGAAVLGPRIGRFDPNVDQTQFDPHNMSMVVLGTIILWFGWYGFNGGSTLGMDSTATANLAGVVACNTTICAATGGATAFFAATLIPWFRRQDDVKLDLLALCNGVLGGLVSITAGCGNVQPYAALVIGIIGGFVYLLADKLLCKLKIDDPLGAFPVHGACGIWGMIAAALFDWAEGFDEFSGWNGWGLTGEKAGKGFGGNLALVAFVIAWSGGLSFLVFFPLKKMGKLRVSEQEELEGLDFHHHAQPMGFKMTDSASPSAGKNAWSKKGIFKRY